MFGVEQSDHVTSLQNVLHVFFMLQEEIDLPARLGIDNVDLFASRHIEKLMIGSDMKHLDEVNINAKWLVCVVF